RICVAGAGAPTSDRASDLAALLARPEAIGEAVLETTPGGWKIIQGDDVLDIEASPLRLTLYRQDRRILSLRGEQLAGLEFGDTDALPDAGRWLVRLPLAEDEGIYGLGESLESLDRRGET